MTSQSGLKEPVAPVSAPAASRRETRTQVQKDSQSQSKKSKASIRYPFWFGGSASSMAACVTHPLDLVKVRLQTRTPTSPQTMSATFLHILRTHGPKGLYNGISASLLRQATYSTVRFGVYEELKTRASRSRPDGKPPPYAALVGMAALSGFLGGISGNAADVLNVRMQGDMALPVEKRRNYKHALDGMVRMIREEGMFSWFRGWWPNSMRAAIMTSSQVASYDIFKSLLLSYTPMKDNLSTHFSASFLAGVTAATVTSPVDVIKTRIMSASSKESILTLVGNIYRADGMLWMFKGWVPSFLRLGPQTICTFIFLEAHRKVYRKFQSIDENGDSMR